MLLSLLFSDYTMLLSLRAKLKIKRQRYRNKKDEKLVLPKMQTYINLYRTKYRTHANNTENIIS